MKTFLRLAVVTLFLTYTSLFAQVNSNYDGPMPEVEKGAKAFVFQYTPFQTNLMPVYVAQYGDYDDGDLSSSPLYGAGFLYYITDQIALGVGLNFGTVTTSFEDTTQKWDDSETTFGIGIDANYHFKPLYSVSPYVGLNLNYGLYSGSYEYTPSGGELSKTEYSGNGFGIAAQCGFDWYFTEGLSLGGKYVLGFQSLGKPTVTYDNGDEDEGPSATAFGISYLSILLNVHL